MRNPFIIFLYNGIWEVNFNLFIVIFRKIDLT